MDDSFSRRTVALAMAGLFCAGFVFGWRWQASAAAEAKAELAQARGRHEAALATAARAALGREHELARQFSDAASRFELEKENAIRESDKVAADLRGGAVRLRRAWAGCETARLSAASSRAAVADGLADSRAASAGRIVRAAAECDAQIRNLQDILRIERQ